MSFSLKTMLVCWVPSAEFFQIFAQYLSELINNMSEGMLGRDGRTKDAGVGECCLSIFQLVYLKALCIIFQTNRPTDRTKNVQNLIKFMQAYFFWFSKINK